MFIVSIKFDLKINWLLFHRLHHLTKSVRWNESSSWCFAVLFNSCVRPKYKFSADDALLHCNITAHFLFSNNGKMFTHASWNTKNDFTLLLCQFYISFYNISIDRALENFRTDKDPLGNFDVILWWAFRKRQKVTCMSDFPTQSSA